MREVQGRPGRSAGIVRHGIAIIVAVSAALAGCADKRGGPISGPTAASGRVAGATITLNNAPLFGPDEINAGSPTASTRRATTPNQCMGTP